MDTEVSFCTMSCTLSMTSGAGWETGNQRAAAIHFVKYPYDFKSSDGEMGRSSATCKVGERALLEMVMSKPYPSTELESDVDPSGLFR